MCNVSTFNTWKDEREKQLECVLFPTLSWWRGCRRRPGSLRPPSRSVSASTHSIEDSASDSHARNLSNDRSKLCREFIAEWSSFPRLMMLLTSNILTFRISVMFQTRLYNCLSPKHVQSFASMFPRCLYGTKPMYRSNFISNCSFYGSCHSSGSWTSVSDRRDMRAVPSEVTGDFYWVKWHSSKFSAGILWFSLANLYSIIAPHSSNALLHP